MPHLFFPTPSQFDMKEDRSGIKKKSDKLYPFFSKDRSEIFQAYNLYL